MTVGENNKQPHLMAQDVTSVDPAKLTALTPQVVRLKLALCVMN